VDVLNLNRAFKLASAVALVALAAACSSSNNSNNSNNTVATKAAVAPSASAAAATAPAASSGTPSSAAAQAAAPAATSAAASAEKPVRGGTLTAELNSNTKNLDPLLSSLVVDRQVHYQIYDSLVTIGPDLKIAPGLADSWDTSDPKTLVFKLHPGVKFQDGTDFNADAVKFNIDRILKSDTSPRKSEITSIASVDVVDPLTVKFNLKSPAAQLLATLVDRAGMMVSPAAVQKYGADLTLTPIGAGTGPFRFVEWKQDDHITLERNPDYWKTAPNGDKLPYLDKVIFRVIVDENARLNNLKTGDVDVVYQPPTKDNATIKKDSSFVYKEVPALDFAGIELNTGAEPFNNKALRQAVAYAIDSDQILKTVFFGVGVVSNGPISPPMPSYDAAFKPYTHDIAKAKAKLAEGGKAGGFSFDLIFTAGSPAAQQEAELVKDELKDAGITANLVPEEFTKLVDDGTKHTFQAAFIGWSGRVDPDGNTFNHFHTGGGNNDPQYSNPQVDDLLDQARANYDVPKRIAQYKQVNQIIVDDAPWVFINHGLAIELHSTKVKGYVLVADTIQRFATVWKSQ
jgi:peptide/nickel transport system substrate-binding protein